MTTEDQAKLKRLLTEACVLSFDCGEFKFNDRENLATGTARYDTLLERSRNARQAVLDFVEELTEKD